MSTESPKRRVRNASWFRFSLRTLFLAVCVCAWLAYQFSVARDRQTIQSQLHVYRCPVLYSSSICEDALNDLCADYHFGIRETGDDLSLDWITVLTGAKNRVNVVVIVPRHMLSVSDRIASLIAQMPRATRVIVWDVGGEDDDDLYVNDFKTRLLEERPKVKVEYIHLPINRFFGQFRLTP